MNNTRFCYQCFCEMSITEERCPKCGYKYTPDPSHPNCLRPGTRLHDRYIVGVALGVGGFGITYKCLDTEIGEVCAIKEFFPARLAVRDKSNQHVVVSQPEQPRFQRIMHRFVEEAELLKKLDHRYVIKVYKSFFEKDTAYYVMEYCDGVDLQKYTNGFTRKLSYDEGMNLLYQTMNALEYIHSNGILHRDIAPDNIFVTKNNFIKILDFGSARREMEQTNRVLSVIVKVGYAPIEQYGGGMKQGAYTDIYALGATFYHLFTSVIPQESTKRASQDTLVPFSRLRPDLPDNLKYCIERAMEIKPSERIASIAEMKHILGIDTVSRSSKPADNIVAPVDASSSRRSESVAVGKKAPLAQRLAATAIDWVFWGLVYLSMMFGMVAPGNVEPGLVFFLFPFFITVINAVAEAAIATTLGKVLMGLCVREKNGAPAAVGQILLRNVVKLAGVFVLIFSKNEELLEDRVTQSVVYIKMR